MLKVYRTNARFIKGRQHDSIVAASSLKEAAKLFGLTLYALRTYGGETGNKHEIKIAMSAPGVVFSRLSRNHSEPFKAESNHD